MSRSDNVAGFYGKLPSHGDFLSRRLPRQFIEPWDQWLQGCIATSSEQLGKRWLDTFLFSPIWQFGLTPGLCGEDAWAGVMMPSVDKVGRYFPLTLAAKVDAKQLKSLFNPACGWFDALAELALSSLEYEFDLQQFDRDLERLCLHNFLSDQSAQLSVNPSISNSAKLAFQFKLHSDEETPQAFVELGETLADRFLAHSSIWHSSAGEDKSASLLLCDGLPPLSAYVGFLNGDWPQHGWQFSSSQVAKKAPVLTDSSEYSKSMNESSIQLLMATTSVDINRPAITDDTHLQEKVELMEKWQSYGLSVVGLKRKLNEDAILLRNDIGLWTVADGMGGHSAGDVASQSLVTALEKIRPFDDLEYYSEQVASNLQAVNRQLQQMAKDRGNGNIIGCTVVVLLIAGEQFRYLWAGDSRLYLYRQGELEQLTLDHSLYNEAISQGLSPMDGSLEEGRGNIITRAVGADPQLQLDFGQGEVLPGDLFILSSDGLDKELSHADIAGFCSNGSVEEITHKLIQEAERRGGRDNISVIAVKV